MTAAVETTDRTVLLLLPHKKEAYPLNTAALTRAQGSQKDLTEGYRDAFILDLNGEVRRIDEVVILGPWGETFGRRLLSRLTDAWSLSVRLSAPLSWPLDNLKGLLAECIKTHPETIVPDASEAARSAIVAAVLSAPSSREVLAALQLPEPGDALDVL